MKLELLQYTVDENNKAELVFRPDDELIEIYKSETGDDIFDAESFDDWLNSLIKYSVDDDDFSDEPSGW